DKTIAKYKEYIQKSETIFVNGTMGLYEDEQFRNGTEHLYQELSKVSAIKIAGGGDAVASINKLNYANVFDFLSTGGGATLEYIVEKQINCFGDK
ncbi:MAG: phosphoglycerate kinase, partial [Bacilli bacterium]|nr:phosphoglycerate kinase [Bacilli bacterium]